VEPDHHWMRSLDLMIWRSLSISWYLVAGTKYRIIDHYLLVSSVVFDNNSTTVFLCIIIYLLGCPYRSNFATWSENGSILWCRSPPRNLGPKTCKISVDFIQPHTLIANISGASQDIQSRKAKWSRAISPAFQETDLVNFGPLITEI